MHDSVNAFEKDVDLMIKIAGECGLDFFDMEFLVSPVEVISSVAAYAVPNRFSHWSFGKRYQKLMLHHRLGLARIHELVFFSEPCLAFVLENNSPLENKLIIAHVIAHSDFFKNNINFSGAGGGKVTSMMACHSRFIDECVEVYGLEPVEGLLDAGLSIRHHIDPVYDPNRSEEEPEKDLILYICRNSRSLLPWQKKILSMVRQESRYFRPLQETRFLNEGWAAYWHTRILREMDLNEAEAVEFARINSLALNTSSQTVNPYRVGVEIFSKLAGWMGDAGIFSIRKEEKDISFLEKYLDHDLAEALDLEPAPGPGKKNLLRSLVNCGNPEVAVDRERSTKGALFLVHRFDGRLLNPRSVRRTLEQVYFLWGDRVFLETEDFSGKIYYSFDGTRHFTGIL